MVIYQGETTLGAIAWGPERTYCWYSIDTLGGCLSLLRQAVVLMVFLEFRESDLAHLTKRRRARKTQELLIYACSRSAFRPPESFHKFLKGFGIPRGFYY